jgi:mono/diheme cytochrome c family protein
MDARLVVSIILVLSLFSLSAAEQANQGKPSSRTQSVASGKALFTNHCASCHGDDAKGAGPAAFAFKVQPPDLTALAKRNHGKFPYDDVYKSIKDDSRMIAHGSSDMPVWGPVFLALTGVNQHVAETRIANLTDYLKSIQVK